MQQRALGRSTKWATRAPLCIFEQSRQTACFLFLLTWKWQTGPFLSGNNYTEIVQPSLSMQYVHPVDSAIHTQRLTKTTHCYSEHWQIAIDWSRHTYSCSIIVAFDSSIKATSPSAPWSALHYSTSFQKKTKIFHIWNPTCGVIHGMSCNSCAPLITKTTAWHRGKEKALSEWVSLSLLHEVRS